MLARIRLTLVAPVARGARVAFALFGVLGLPVLGACAHRSAMCSRTCDEGFACVAGECLRAGTVPDVEAVDRLGFYRARRIVVAPVDVARLARAGGSLASEARDARATPTVATLGRERDADSILLLRFALDLPPDATLLAAHLVLDRAPTFEPDPTPVALHATRILDRWDSRSVAWGRAPRLDDARSPVTTVDDARTQVRLDVRALVRRWRRHAADDQGIALVADRASATGMAFALADGAGAKSAGASPLPVRTLRDTPPAFHGRAGVAEGLAEGRGPNGPRLELYLSP